MISHSAFRDDFKFEVVELDSFSESEAVEEERKRLISPIKVSSSCAARNPGSSGWREAIRR